MATPYAGGLGLAAGRPESPEVVRAARSDPSGARGFHPVPHAFGCGLRVDSPHETCQALVAPYRGAEVLADRHGGRTVLCHVCGARWAAAA